MTRNFALRDRGFMDTSSSLGRMGFLHGAFSLPRGLHAANMCFTIRSRWSGT